MRFRKRVGDSAAQDLRPVIYGDLPLDQWPADAEASASPWSTFVAAREAWHQGEREAAIAAWAGLAHDYKLESRHNLQAWHFLRMAGVLPSGDESAQVFGVIAEVSVGGGHDVLAAYSDGTARYLNHAGGIVVVDDTSLENLAEAIHSWLGVGERLAPVVGAWEEPTLPPLPRGHTRILMLTPGGFRFGQGPDDQLRAEPAAAAFLDAATHLLVAVTRAAAK